MRDGAIGGDDDSEDDGGTGLGVTCLVDSDGDGFGVAGTSAPCPVDDAGLQVEIQPGDCDDSDPTIFAGAPINRCDEKDNDCDGHDETPMPEVCNGIDDDCVEDIDNGVANACGLCGELPSDTCNWVDDDCDGVLEPNMVGKVADGEKVVTQPGAGTSFLNATLVERGGEGAWLLHNSSASSTKGNTILARRVERDAQLAPASTVHAAASAAEFRVDSDGKWVAVLSRRLPVGADPANREWVRLQLFDADDMSLVSETTLLSADDCGVAVHDVAILQDSAGSVMIASVFTANASCSVSLKTYFQVSRYDGPWTLSPRTDLAKPRTVAIERVPCREEWLMVRSQGQGDMVAEKYSAQGALLSATLDTLDDIVLEDAVLTLQRGEESCDRGGVSMLLAMGVTGSESGGQPLLRQWSVNPQSGAIGRSGPDVRLESYYTFGLRVRQSGGRWFASGGFIDDSKPHLFEVTFGAMEPLRDITLITVPGAYPGEGKRTPGDVIDTGGALVVAIPSTGGNLSAHRTPDDTDPAAAVMYTIGCPPSK
jgi:hypothetical protein